MVLLKQLCIYIIFFEETNPFETMLSVKHYQFHFINRLQSSNLVLSIALSVLEQLKQELGTLLWPPTLCRLPVLGLQQNPPHISRSHFFYANKLFQRRLGKSTVYMSSSIRLQLRTKFRKLLHSNIKNNYLIKI